MNDNGYLKYGYFSRDGKSFVITNPKTPRPWVNYTWSDNFLVSLDQRGEGKSILKDEHGNLSIPIKDRLGFIKFCEANEVYSIAWGKKSAPDECYRITHGLGFSSYHFLYNKIEIIWTITATKTQAEIWQIKIKNCSTKAAKLQLYSGVEFALAGYEPYGTLENYFFTRAVSARAIYSENRYFERKNVRNNGFFAASENARSMECSREKFIGDCYNSWSNATGFDSVELSNSMAMNELEIGLMNFDLELYANEEKSFYFVNGSCFDESDISQYNELDFEKLFDESMEYANARTKDFERINIDLGDESLTQFFNIWSKQQLFLLKDFARIFLIGFRDTLQDATSLVAYVPELAKKSILTTMKYQYHDGSALRGWAPIDEHKYADSGVWLAMAVAEYLRETMDINFLAERQKFYDQGEATVWGHLKKSLEWFSTNLGEHNLPKMYFGDWNDSLNIGRFGKGESVWLAMALVVALRDTMEIAELINDGETFEFCHTFHDTLKGTIEAIAWDGEWYIRGFDDDGNVVGSKKNRYGKIFSEPQSWAVMAALNPERVATALQSVDKYLRTANGLVVCDPPFMEYQENVGRISCMLPGWGENGSCYCHVTAFQVVADALHRDGERAWESLMSILPFHEGLDIDVSKLEPYAFSNMFRGPANVRNGETFKGWTSGTVPWCLRGLTHYIFGLRPNYDELIIAPLAVSKLAEIKMSRTIRNYQIELKIENLLKLESKNAKLLLTINGKDVISNRIKFNQLDEHGVNYISAQFIRK